MIMKSTDFNKNAEAEFRKDFVRGVRRMNERKEIPDYSARELEEVEMEETVADSIENNEKRSTKGLGWLIGIAAVFAICIMVVGLLSHDGSPLASRNGDRLASVAPAREQGETVKLHYVSEGAETVDAATQQTAPAAKQRMASATTTAAQASASAASGSAYDDRIEREAREVIHGDFGNNPDRKAALGADYAAVQERVNEILHE